eukprot:4930530-Prymnesium_polylepis.1
MPGAAFTRSSWRSSTRHRAGRPGSRPPSRRSRRRTSSGRAARAAQTWRPPPWLSTTPRRRAPTLKSARGCRARARERGHRDRAARVAAAVTEAEAVADRLGRAERPARAAEALVEDGAGALGAARVVARRRRRERLGI